MDLVALKYVVMLNGVTQLIMTKADVLDSFETIKIATKYKVNGEITDHFPFDIETEIEPIYQDFKGWNTDTTKMRNFDELPKEFKDYMKFIEREVGIPIKYVSVGPDREQIITM
jgi:adenylosuccinate synthase